MDMKSVAIALLVVFIWGVNFSAIKLGLEQLPPFLFSGMRFLICAVPAVFFVPFPKTPVYHVILVGLFLGVMKFSLLFIAMQSDASAGISSLLLQAQVIFTVILSVLLFRERLNGFQLLGIIIACSGFSLFFVTSGGGATLFGVVLLLGAAVFWSVANIVIKYAGKVNLLHFMVWVSLIPPVPLFALSYLYESNAPITLLLAMTEQAWLSLMYVGYISTLVAFALWGWLMVNYPSASVAPFALLIPVVGVIGANLLLGEQLNKVELIGGGIILVGLSISVLGKTTFSKAYTK
ncbi:EamA family transporter [Pseudoalteromonas luteoviolacea]|uniref:EamA family transporter n=1 Tax=Pseudoalteromonas luteoviolacea TaxID=43657 RepID=UPI001EEF35D8|nr:EamA family transporter [Pseudoalteromonas luteoviolacea]MCF6441970.1 EamA family transporter [Pseudoalteromonas luteoviolacea]